MSASPSAVRALAALHDVEAQRDDAIAYLSAIKGLMDVLAGGHGVQPAAQAIARTFVRELGVESCALALREDNGALAIAGFATQGERLGGPRDPLSESGWLALAQLVGAEPGPVCFRRAPDGGFAAIPTAELAAEGCVVLPFRVADADGGALVLHWLVAPAQGFARGPALALLAEGVGQALTVARARDAGERLLSQLQGDLGAAEYRLSAQEAGLRATQEHVEELTRHLLRSAQVKNEFLGTVSHELKTPLNAILGYGSLLRDGMCGDLSSSQQEMLTRILGGAQHLNALIDDMLFFVQVESDRVLVRPEPVDVAEVIDAALAALPTRPAPDQVALHVTVDRAAAELLIDARLLKRIVFHLLRNAFKFTSKGEIVLRVERTAERGAAQIVVRDTGAGIPAERIEAIFDLFTQADSSTTRRFDGLGMGLTLVQRCCRLLGGDVSVESAVGVGSEFRVHLPGTVVDAATVPAGERPATGAPIAS